jgi:hypothetical protein
MKPLPTDLEILNAIYDQHYNEFAHHADKRPKKAVVAVDISTIAERLGVDPDIIYGRLRYHLDHRYAYQTNHPTDPDNLWIRLFIAKTAYDIPQDSVHFPYLASVLAEMRADEKKQQTQTNIAWFSLAVSILAVIVSVFN